MSCGLPIPTAPLDAIATATDHGEGVAGPRGAGWEGADVGADGREGRDLLAALVDEALHLRGKLQVVALEALLRQLSRHVAAQAVAVPAAMVGNQVVLFGVEGLSTQVLPRGHVIKNT